MTQALVALGSNLGGRRATLAAALDALARLPRTRLVARSRLHETAPEGCPPGSPPFLNAACLLETDLSPEDLLAGLQRLEAAHGRRRGAPNAPRTLDLDLILYGERIIERPDLRVPHPRAHEREFVLAPAVEVAPRLRHPRRGGRTLAELLVDLRETRAGGAA